MRTGGLQTWIDPGYCLENVHARYIHINVFFPLKHQDKSVQTPELYISQMSQM